MTSILIYLDEIGDLGWSFDKPYRRGGSSRHLTIASLIVSPSAKHLPKRALKKLYQKHGWNPKIEKKWADMNSVERGDFANRALQLIEKHGDIIRYLAITVRKENVPIHIRADANKLYNYMIALLLLNEMSKYDAVTFIPDPRTIKVESGNSLHDYLQTELWFRKLVKTRLNTQPCDSAASANLQFTDMLSGIMQSHFEDANSQWWRKLAAKISSFTLFF